MSKYKAINQYHSQLSKELCIRYGGVEAYTQAQISTAICDLGMSEEYIQYAYLLYGGKNYQKQNSISEKDYESMIEDIEKALDGGMWSKPVEFVSKVFGLSGSAGDVGGCGGGE